MIMDKRMRAVVVSTAVLILSEEKIFSKKFFVRV